MTEKPVILIGTPCYGGVVTQNYMESVIQLMVSAAARESEMTLALLGHDSLITRSRNKLVATFLDMPRATHLLFVDADIGFHPEHVHRMLDFDQDVVAGMYPVKNIDWTLVKQRFDPDATAVDLAESGLDFVGLPLGRAEREERDGFVTGTYAGTGFMLIKRACLERMCVAYAETKYHLSQVWPREKRQSENQFALFDCMIEPETNIYLSEDFAFCRRWRQIGGEIWLDTRSRLTHLGSYQYAGDPTIVTVGPAVAR